MQKILFVIFTCTIFVISTVFLYAESTLIAGTEKPTVKECDNSATVYVYDDYIIYTEPSGDFGGVNIYIYAPMKKDDLCKLNPRLAHYAVGVGEYGGVNKFAGKYENLILIDKWTGRDFKRLLAINIENKSLVFMDTYAEPKIEGGELNYFRTLKSKRKSVRDKIPCPNATKWESEGKQVLYVERMSVDLDTMKKVSSGELSCIPAEPIGTTKPRRYGH